MRADPIARVGRAAPVVLLCVLLDTGAVSSQVSGTVRARDLGPLPAAEILVWGDRRLLDRLTTDQKGFFHTDVPRPNVRRLSVHHIGFSTEIVSDPKALSSPVVVWLDRLPVPLPEVEVVVSRELCSGDPDPRARDLWSTASRRYAEDTGSRGGLVGGHLERGDVTADRVGEVTAAQLRPRMSRWRGARPGQTLEDRVARDGYAVPVQSGMSVGARHLNWIYPLFEERHAYHFSTAAFGENHRFYLVHADETGAELAFCPGSSEGSGLRGRIRLSGDSMFVSARWSVPHLNPDEAAGGEVVFGEVEDSAGQRHLVSLRGSYWRRSGGDVLYPNLPRRYYHVVRLNTEWIISKDFDWPDCRPRWCTAR
jgi:hypothetical protein